jgi:NagD protein
MALASENPFFKVPYQTKANKPNPMMMRHALRHLGCQREDTAIIGDRMDTDIIAGINSDIDTVLVLSGVTSREDLQRFAYHPRYILDGVIDIPG